MKPLKCASSISWRHQSLLPRAPCPSSRLEVVGTCFPAQNLSLCLWRGLNLPPTTRIKKGGLKHLLAFWENVWTQTKSTKTPTYCWAPCLEDCSSRLKYYVYIIMNHDWSCMFIFCNFGHVFHFLNLAFVQPAARTQLGTTVQTSDVWCQPQETDSRRTLHPFPSWWNGGGQLSTAADPSCFMASEVRL